MNVANYEILCASEEDEVSSKFLHTYAGKAWKVIQKSLRNEILISLARMMTLIQLITLKV